MAQKAPEKIFIVLRLYGSALEWYNRCMFSGAIAAKHNEVNSTELIMCCTLIKSLVEQKTRKKLERLLGTLCVVSA